MRDRAQGRDATQQPGLMTEHLRQKPPNRRGFEQGLDGGYGRLRSGHAVTGPSMSGPGIVPHCGPYQLALLMFMPGIGNWSSA